MTTAKFTDDEVTNARYIPDAFGREPETVADVLEAAACLLDEEGRWAQGEWFHHNDPTLPEYNEDPFCNGWSACADGALQLVSVGVFRGDATGGAWMCNVGKYSDSDEITARWNLYVTAHRELRRTIGEGVAPWESDGVIGFNDRPGRSRTEVVGMFRRAARRAAETGVEPLSVW